jgi:Holliday junction resolvasome RuvABC endonuclease subunit
MLVGGKLHAFHGWTPVKKLQKQFPDTLCWFKSPSNTEQHKQNRLQVIADWVCGMVREYYNAWPSVHCYAAIEGYAFAIRSRGLSDLHELGGAIKRDLWMMEVPYRIYDPKSVKLAWTGYGSAEKEDMIAAAGDLFGVDLSIYGSAADNLADAMLLAALLDLELDLRAGEVPLKSLPERQRLVLLRATKAEPEALITRPLVEWDDGLTKPILARGSER